MARIRVLFASGPLRRQLSSIAFPTYASTADSGSSRRTISLFEYAARASEMRAYRYDKSVIFRINIERIRLFDRLITKKSTNARRFKKVLRIPLKLIPFSPISVCSPFGSIAKSCSRLHARIISLNLSSWSGWPKRIFSRTVAFRIHAVWGVYATVPPRTIWRNYKSRTLQPWMKP